jgi:hypothetical protein
MVGCDKVQLRRRARKVAIRQLSEANHFGGPWILTVTVVEHFMAAGAHGNQFGILIRAPLTSQLLVVSNL